MVQTWGQSDGGVETCGECGARYKVTIHRATTRDKDEAHCHKCGHLLRAWNDTHWPSFVLIRDEPVAPNQDG